MSTDPSLEELGEKRDIAVERLTELQRERSGALPVEVAALDSMIASVRAEINSIEAKILSRISPK
jgi:hypothetical protein